MSEAPRPRRPAGPDAGLAQAAGGSVSGRDLPWGHSRSAHQLFGWCSDCAGRSPAEEVTAWRGWGFAVLRAAEDAARATA